MKKIFIVFCFIAGIFLFGTNTVLAQEPTYIGATGNFPACQACHSGAPGGDQFSSWSQTAHAAAYDSVNSFVQQNAACLPCHTTGWVDSLANEGADDFVTVDTTKSSFNITIDDSTNYLARTNVQCEACHGPGSDHTGDPSNIKPAADAASAENCGRCHQGEHHPNLTEWQASKHANSLTSEAVPDFLLTDTDCAGCHTLQGFIQFVGTTPEDSTNNIPENIVGPGSEAYPVNCATCHDPHDPKHPGQLRLPPEQLCVKCHNPEDAAPPDNPHHSTASMFAGMGAAELVGVQYTRQSVHQLLAPAATQKCVTCHVFMTPFDEGDPNDPGDDMPAFVGHTFEPRIEGCTQAGCHTGGLADTGGEEFNHRGRQTFTQGLIDSLANVLADIEQNVLPTATPADSEKYEIGLFNLRFASNEGSRGVHNPEYAEDVLTSTIAFLDTTLLVSVEELPNANIPVQFELHQNYPNPFNPSTTIRFDVPRAGHVKLVIYNALGQIVETLVDEQLVPNVYQVDFNASDLSSGLYFYRVEADNFVSVKKMLLLK